MHIGAKINMRPNVGERTLLSNYFGARRKIWNYFLDKHNGDYDEAIALLREIPADDSSNEAVQLRKTYRIQTLFNAYNASRELTILQGESEYAWLEAIPRAVKYAAIEDLQRAFDAYFAKRRQKKEFVPKKPRKDGRPDNWPRFQVRHADQSCRMRIDPRSSGLGLQPLNDRSSCAVFPAARDKPYGILKPLKFTRKGISPDTARIVLTTFNKRATGYTCSLMMDVKDLVPAAIITGAGAVGIDVGISAIATTSDGTTWENPRHYEASMSRLHAYQRRTARCYQARKKNARTAPSNREKKQRYRVAHIHQTIANQRSNYAHQISNYLTTSYDAICVETLNIDGMKRNRKIAKAISHAAMGRVILFTQYKAARRQKLFTKIDRWEPTSKTCSACGQLHDMPLKKRIMSCDCGNVMDRDLNAAINIRNRGVKLLRASVQDMPILSVTPDALKKAAKSGTFAWCFVREKTGLSRIRHHSDLIPVVLKMTAY